MGSHECTKKDPNSRKIWLPRTPAVLSDMSIPKPLAVPCSSHLAIETRASFSRFSSHARPRLLGVGVNNTSYAPRLFPSALWSSVMATHNRDTRISPATDLLSAYVRW